MRQAIIPPIFWVITLLTAAAVSLHGEDELNMYLDYSRFRYDETHTYLEIYYLLHEQSGADREITLDFSLKDRARDSVLASNLLKVSIAGDPASSSSTRGSVIKTIVPPGNYQVKMVRLDETGSTRLDSLTQDLNTATFASERISLSDIEICSNIITGSSNSDGVFYKNTMEVFPNPPRMFSRENPQLFYYAEVYNIQPDPSTPTVEIQVAIKDSEGNIYEARKYDRPRTYESLVEKGRYDVSGLRNGIYTLMFAVVDSAHDYSVYQIKEFFIANHDEAVFGVGDPMGLFPASEFYMMPLEMVEERFEQARYLAKPAEVQIYEGLDEVEAKRIFMFRFWLAREKEDPGIQAEYYERTRYATEAFGYSNRPGWKSDRGRVYMLFGEPNEIYRRPYEPDARPFEVWYYHELDSGARFLFVDETGFKQYRQASSTKRGELYDPTYDEYLFMRDQ